MLPTAQAYTRYGFIVYCKLKLKEDMYIFWKVSYHIIFHSMKCVFSAQIELKGIALFSCNVLLHYFHPLQPLFSIIVAVADTDAYRDTFMHRLGKFYLAQWDFGDMIDIIIKVFIFSFFLLRTMYNLKRLYGFEYWNT